MTVVPAISARSRKVLFSTKAEYGIRVMVELALSEDASPVSLAAIAERDNLPLAYLEHLVAKLRRAGLIESRRGAHGGYLLAKPAHKITAAEIVEVLEGPVIAIECITEQAEAEKQQESHPKDESTRGRGCPGYDPAPANSGYICTREMEHDHNGCPTQLLWNRVHGSVLKTLRTTKLSDLVRERTKPLAA